jgi:hypothetical protein
MPKFKLLACRSQNQVRKLTSSFMLKFNPRPRSAGARVGRVIDAEPTCRNRSTGFYFAVAEKLDVDRPSFDTRSLCCMCVIDRQMRARDKIPSKIACVSILPDGWEKPFT